MRNVYYFNATNDLALANNGIAYTPPALLQNFEADLATLPCFIASSSDYVIVPTVPSAQYIESMEMAGFKMPRFISYQDFFQNRHFEALEIEEIRPWGWSKSTHLLFDDAKQFTSSRFRSGSCASWNDELRNLCSRTSARTVLSELTSGCVKEIVPAMAVAQRTTDLSYIETRLQAGETLVLKLPWSSAGRGLLIVRKDLYNEANKQWIVAGIKSQGYIMVEPWFERHVDFSFLYTYDSGNLAFNGVSAFQTGSKGQFIGNYVHWSEKHGTDIDKFFTNDRIVDVACLLGDALKKLPLNLLFAGRLGVDAMLVRHCNEWLIHPCVEINFRATIGHIALEIRKLWNNRQKAFFQIGTKEIFNSQAVQKGLSEVNNGEFGKGLFAVTPITPKTHYVAWLDIIE